jgi:hypothetical protein
MQTITYKDIFITIIAHLKGMIGREIIPVALLVFCENAGPVAEWTYAAQGFKNG